MFHAQSIGIRDGRPEPSQQAPKPEPSRAALRSLASFAGIREEVGQLPTASDRPHVSPSGSSA
jgi:hypothetical protein